MDDTALICPHCGGPVPKTRFKQQKYCGSKCRKDAWNAANRERCLRAAREYKARRNEQSLPEMDNRAEESWQRLIACTDENHRYKPASFEQWKREIGVTK